MATMNYLRPVLLILLVLVPVGCGGETATEAPAAEERTTEEPTTATTAVDSSLYYVALGDSLATGYGLTGYVDRYAGLLGADTGSTVDVYNLGVNGLTSDQLRAGVESDRRVKEALERADVITINIGANDLLLARGRYRTGNCGGTDNQDCLRQAVGDFQENWDAILAGVTGIRSPDTAVIRTMDFYNPSVAIDRLAGSWPSAGANDFEVFKEYLEQVNSHIARSSDAHSIPHARVYEAFNGPNGDEDPSAKGYISADGIHPSDDGHAAIARELRELAYEPLTSGAT